MRVRFVGVVAGVVIGLSSACTDDGGDGGSAASPAGTPPAATAPWPPFDPPTAFDPASAFTIGAQENSRDVVLHGTNVFLATPTAVLAFDLTTRRAEEPVRPERPPVGGDLIPQRELSPVRHVPVLAVVDARPVVVVAYPVGDVQSPGVDLLIIDAETRRPLPTMKLDFTAAEIGPRRAILESPVVGVRGSLIVLSVRPGPTVVVDLGTRKVLWHNREARAHALLGGTVLAAHAFEDTPVLGLALETGATRWTALPGSSKPAIATIGPRFAVVVVSGYSPGGRYFSLIDADGRPRALDRDPPENRQGTVECRFDDVSVAVCTFRNAGRRPYLAAFDAEQGREIWRQPELTSDSLAPDITAAWHGLVYGQTGDGQGVILDARTGKVRNRSTVVPVAVNAFAAVAAAPTSKDPIQVYRATSTTRG